MRSVLLRSNASLRRTCTATRRIAWAQNGGSRITARVMLSNAARQVSTASLDKSCADAAAPLQLSPLTRGMAVRAFFEKSGSATAAPIAGGVVKARIAGSTYAVHLQHLFLSPIVEVGSRVYVEHGRDEECVGAVVGGVVVRVNGNGTYGVLLDNNRLDTAVPAEMVVLSEARAKLVSGAEYGEVVAWLRTAGVARRAHQESIACILYQRGWRVDRLYLLTTSDMHCMTHIPRAVRMCVLDKSEWQRDHHRQMRGLLRERVKERDFRYTLTKYSGVVSASMALLGIAFAFGWNMTTYRTQQRAHQLSVAVRTLTQPLNLDQSALQAAPLMVRQGASRDREESAVRRVLHRLDAAHPRIPVFTRPHGCGKSTVWRSAVLKEGVPHVCVDVRATEDTLRSVVKALGVGSVDVCGDLLDFVEEACRMARAARGETPLLLLRLREGSSLQRVYRDVAALAFDRRVCHVVMEVPAEALSMASAGLPRLDLCVIPAFSREEAFAHTQRAIDPVSLSHFVDVVGTSSSDVDELIAAVRQRRASAAQYTNARLLKAMRQLQATCASRPELRAALQQLSACPYDAGQHSGVDAAALHSTALVDIVLYDPVADAWRFRSKLFHTASRCCWL
nr:unnamed protein product [Leishmania braziliensis]